MSCEHEHCGGGGGCGGCGGTLQMTQAEIDLLLDFAQTPFLPVARRADSEAPIYLESDQYTAEEYEKIITALYQKRLIRLDYDLPLANFDYAAYRAYPHRGSMALTATGQHVVELLEIQGIPEA
ncbi:MAG: hypothetical protein VB094_02615 [Oscillibacter sp.]|nr:hypothetical protein [Oscillibacter sp.]